MGNIFEILELFALQSLFVCTITTLTVFIIKTANLLMIRHVDIFVFTLTILIRRSEKHLRQCSSVLSTILLKNLFVSLFVRRLSKFQVSKFLWKPVRQRSGVPVLSAGGIYCRISAGIYHHHTHAAHFPNTFNVTNWEMAISDLRSFNQHRMSKDLCHSSKFQKISWDVLKCI